MRCTDDAQEGPFLFFLLLSVSLIAYALAGLSGGELLRAVALSFGITILYVLIYPRLRGVRKGDAVVVVAHTFVPSFLGRKGTLLSSASKQNQEVRVLLDNGVEVRGVLESFEELLSPPRVRLIYEERMTK